MSITLEQIAFIPIFIFVNVFIFPFMGSYISWFYEHGYSKMIHIFRADGDVANMLLFMADAANATAMSTLYIVLDVTDTNLKVAFISITVAQMVWQLWKYFYWIRRAHALGAIVNFISFVLTFVGCVYTWISVSDTIGSNSNGYLSGAMTIIVLVLHAYFGLANLNAWWVFDGPIQSSDSERLSINNPMGAKRIKSVSMY